MNTLAINCLEDIQLGYNNALSTQLVKEIPFQINKYHIIGGVLVLGLVLYAGYHMGKCYTGASLLKVERKI